MEPKFLNAEKAQLGEVLKIFFSSKKQLLLDFSFEGKYKTIIIFKLNFSFSNPSQLYSNANFKYIQIM